MRKYFLALLFGTTFFSINLNANLFEDNLRIVGESEKDTEQAKQEAIDKGREESLIFVISKIVSKSSLEKIQELLVETKPFSFEKRFSLKKENITNKKYSADANFVFDERKIKNFLDANRIPFTVVSLGRYIIIPNYYENGKLVEENIWSNYWMQLSYEENIEFLSTLIYYENKNIIEDKERLFDIKNNLNLDDIYLLNLKAEKDGTYTLEIISGTTNKKQTIKEIKSIQRATMIAPSEIEEKKKSEVLSSYSSNSSEQKLRVASKDYESWVFIEKQLDKINEVSSFSLETIGSDYIVVYVKLKDNVEKFKKEMEKQCVIFDIPSLELSKDPKCL